MTIYLYIKTHKVTGLKYLGKTNAKDLHKYKGSGIYWTRHIKEHGNDVHTEILHECRTNEEARELGVYYSNLWDVVNAVDESGRKIWANLVPEEGAGGWGGVQNPNNLPHIKEAKRQLCLTNNPIHLPGVKQKVSENTKKAMWDPEIRERYLAGIHSTKWKESRAKRVGELAPNFDNTIYTFQHKDGTVINQTKSYMAKTYGIDPYSLIKGRLKTSKGWRLDK